MSGWSDAPRCSCRSKCQVKALLHPTSTGRRSEVSKIIFVEDLEQFISAHLPWITSDAPEHPQQSRTLAVFRRCDILKVINRPVRDVAVDVVNLHRNSCPVWSHGERSRSNPRECNQFVTKLFVILPHDRIYTSALTVETMPSRSAHRRREVWLNFPQHPTVIRQNGVVKRIEFSRSATIERLDRRALTYNSAIH